MICYLIKHNIQCNDRDKLILNCPYSLIGDECSFKGNCFYL